MSRSPPRLVRVAHQGTFRCPHCSVVRPYEASYPVPVDEAEGISQQNRDDVARLAASDERLVRCPSCGRRPRLGFLVAMIVAVAFPVLAVGATSLLVGRYVVGVVGLAVGLVVVGFGVRAPGSADRALRFLEGDPERENGA